MGLLDGLFATPSDQALWALGSGLLGVRRGNEGRALFGAMGAYNDAQQEQRRNQLTQAQMKELESQAAQRQVIAAELQRKAQTQEATAARLAAIRATLPPQMQSVFDIAPEKWAEAQLPKAAPLTDLGKLRQELAALPPGDPAIQQYQAAIKKATEFAPPMQLQMPPPVTYLQGMGANGPEFYQAPTRAGQQPQPTGIRPVPPNAGAGKDLTEAQAKASAFLGQMRSASTELEQIGGDRASLNTQFNVALAGGAANPITSAQAQKINQAQEQWAEAFLRFKTGAASTEQEVKRNVATFFPRIGDKPEVVEQKKRMRAQAEKDMEVAAGRGVEKINAQQPPTKATMRWNPETKKLEPVE